MEFIHIENIVTWTALNKKILTTFSIRVFKCIVCDISSQYPYYFHTAYSRWLGHSSWDCSGPDSTSWWVRRSMLFTASSIILRWLAVNRGYAAAITIGYHSADW